MEPSHRDVSAWSGMPVRPDWIRRSTWSLTPSAVRWSHLPSRIGRRLPSSPTNWIVRRPLLLLMLAISCLRGPGLLLCPGVKVCHAISHAAAEL